MRCRKVRSCLSAYCNDELSGSDRLAIAEHLSTCSACRKEAAIYNSINENRSEISELKVSNDFNVNLLNRIAQERFAETRTKAYLPRTAPRVVWGRAIPAFVTACLVLVVSVVMLTPGAKQGIVPGASDSRSLSDAYLTVQPTTNPNLTVNLDQGWSLADQLARVERVSVISNRLSRADGFDWDDYSSGLRQASSHAGYRAPYAPNYYQVRPVVRIYGLPGASSVKEVTKVY